MYLMEKKVYLGGFGFVDKKHSPSSMFLKIKRINKWIVMDFLMMVMMVLPEILR